MVHAACTLRLMLLPFLLFHLWCYSWSFHAAFAASSFREISPLIAPPPSSVSSVALPCLCCAYVLCDVCDALFAFLLLPASAADACLNFLGIGDSSRFSSSIPSLIRFMLANIMWMILHWIRLPQPPCNQILLPHQLCSLFISFLSSDLYFGCYFIRRPKSLLWLFQKKTWFSLLLFRFPIHHG